MFPSAERQEVLLSPSPDAEKQHKGLNTGFKHGPCSPALLGVNPKLGSVLEVLMKITLKVERRGD